MKKYFIIVLILSLSRIGYSQSQPPPNNGNSEEGGGAVVGGGAPIRSGLITLIGLSISYAIVRKKEFDTKETV